MTTEEIATIAGISEHARRLRELRDDEGMQILSYRDRPDLKPNEYVLVSTERVPRFAHRVDKATRVRILERNGLSCGVCGAIAGDPDPYNANRRITLHVDHIDPDGPTEDDNLRALCHNCNEGRKNLSLPPKPSLKLVMRQIRNLGRAEQRQVFEELKRKFEPPD